MSPKLSFLLLLLLSMSAREPSKPVHPTDAHFALVELFTSEGCSSCPPAEDVLLRLNREMKGKPVYFLVYHVDYWDRGGWKDKFSQAAFSSRQHAYATQLKMSPVYTPQAIVNGRAELIGSQEGNLRNQITKALRERTDDEIQITRAAFEPKHQVNLEYALQCRHTPDSRVIAALVQLNATSSVRGGENEGRTLEHVNIVRTLESQHASGSEHFTLTRPPELNEQQLKVVVFLQNEQTGYIMAANESSMRKP